ncbi:MAG: sulfatase-like hydrolase/transferase [Bacilli bacterium]|nr:sulfatase-like hydrolase/transferase [Bacilli bacterium]
MELKKNKIIYLIAYFGLNIMMCFLLTSNLILKDLSPFPRDFFMYLNSFFGDFGFFLIFISLSILIFKTDYARARFLMIVSIAFGVFFLAISVYFQYYGMFFSFYNLATFSSTSGGQALGFLLASVWALLKQAKLFFLLSALLMIVLFIILFFKKRKDEVFRKSALVSGKRRLLLGFISLFLAILIMFSSLKAYKYSIDDTWYEDNATPLYGSQAVGLFNYYVYDAYSYYIADKEGYTENIVEEIKIKLEALKSPNYLSPIDNRTTQNEDYKNIYAGKNLLLIQVESLNDFVVGLKVKVGDEYVEVTPNLNKMINESVYFNDFYTTVGIGNTSDAEFTVLTGLYPTGYNYTVYEYANVEYQTLPRLFSEAGYSSFSSHANQGDFYSRDKLHPSLYGFDYHIAEEQFEYSEEDLIHTWINDEVFLRKTIDVMKTESVDGPVFTFAITISCHMPYGDPEEKKGINLFPGKDNLLPEDFKLVNSISLNEQITGYLEHASYTDYAIGKAMQYLEESGLAEDTIVML